MSDRILTADEMNRLFAALIQNETRKLIAGGALILAAQAGLIPDGDQEPFEETAEEIPGREAPHAPLGPGQPAQRPETQPAGHLQEKKKPGRPPKHPPAASGPALPPVPGYQTPALGGPRPGGPLQ